MNYVPTKVIDRRTMQNVPAVVCQCDHCGCDKFIVFIVNQNHPHLQCAKCGVTHCQGNCDGEIAGTEGSAFPA
jgi:hypothetical protein